MRSPAAPSRGNFEGKGAKIRTQAEGRSRAQKRGSAWAVRGKLTAAQRAEVRRLRAEGATLAELARNYGVGKSTISRLA
jgi:DNA invertase Pin-like site-specific DNA recombinase